MIISQEKKIDYLENDSIKPEVKELFEEWLSGDMYIKEFFNQLKQFYKDRGIYDFEHFYIKVPCIKYKLEHYCSTINIPHPEEFEQNWKELFDPINTLMELAVVRLDELYDILEKCNELKDFTGHHLAYNMIPDQVEFLCLSRKMHNIAENELPTSDKIANIIKLANDN